MDIARQGWGLRRRLTCLSVGLVLIGAACGSAAAETTTTPRTFTAKTVAVASATTTTLRTTTTTLTAPPPQLMEDCVDDVMAGVFLKDGALTGMWEFAHEDKAQLRINCEVLWRTGPAKVQAMADNLRVLRTLATTPRTTTPPPATVPPRTTPPRTTPPLPAAVGPTALCRDGTYSYSAHHQGTCSYHGGVAEWYK